MVSLGMKKVESSKEVDSIVWNKDMSPALSGPLSGVVCVTSPSKQSKLFVKS